MRSSAGSVGRQRVSASSRFKAIVVVFCWSFWVLCYESIWPSLIKLTIPLSLNITTWSVTSHNHTGKYNHINIQAFILSANQGVCGIYLTNLAGIYSYLRGEWWKMRQMVHLIV